MDFTKVFEDYYDSHRYQDIIEIYHENRNEIERDEYLMYCIIDCFIALHRYKDADRLVDERLPSLFSKRKERELSKEESEDLSILLESKCEIYEARKKYLRLYLLLIKHWRCIEVKEKALESLNVAEQKVHKCFFSILMITLVLDSVGLLLSSFNIIEHSNKGLFILIGIFILILNYLATKIVRTLSKNRSKELE